MAFLSISTDLVPGDTNGRDDVFVHDRQTGETTRASVDSQGAEANGDSQWSGLSISAAGRFVVFSSEATNLVPGDTNGAWDVFVRDREGPCSVPASWTNYGSGWPGTNGVPSFTSSGDPTICAAFTLNLDNSRDA